jgi:hypothetical protein
MTPYDEGYTAYGKGKDFSDNPYKRATWECESWWDGWQEAQRLAYFERTSNV